MEPIFDWLRQQNDGVQTHIEFRKKMLALRLDDRRYAALGRMLADLAGRFVDDYYNEPLPASIAREALVRLTQLVQRSIGIESASAEDQLALLNEFGVAELV